MALAMFDGMPEGALRKLGASVRETLGTKGIFPMHWFSYNSQGIQVGTQ